MASTPLSKRLTATRIQRPAPLREGVYEALLELITRHELPPGQHLVESELAEQLGVSRQPVREALQRLNTEGWVNLRPGHGAFVHQPSEDESEQLFTVRALLETESARLAARNATEEDAARLRELWRAGAASLREGDTDAVVAANADLHYYITELSGNAVLAELAGQVARRVRWHHVSVVRRRGEDAWDEHAEIVEAIAAGDETTAADLMRRHLERTRSAYYAQFTRSAT